jgi:hypothetical protein
MIKFRLNSWKTLKEFHYSIFYYMTIILFFVALVLFTSLYLNIIFIIAFISGIYLFSIGEIFTFIRVYENTVVKIILYLVVITMFFHFNVTIAEAAIEPENVPDVVKEAIKDAKAVVGDVNNTINVNNPSINNPNINNPHVNFPIGGFAYLGIAGAAGTGMMATASVLKKSTIPLPAKLGAMALMGIVGGTTASVANGVNTAIQKNLSNTGSPTKGSGGGNFTNFPSMELGNSDLDAVMDILNGNLIIHLCILGFI